VGFGAVLVGCCEGEGEGSVWEAGEVREEAAVVEGGLSVGAFGDVDCGLVEAVAAGSVGGRASRDRSHDL
jgi:hypothetical protein